MSNIKQKELLSEGFWDKFGAVKRIGQEAIKQIGSVVAPEIAEPIKKGTEKMRDISKNIKRAAKTIDQIVKEQIIESGYFPYEKIKWSKNNRGGFKKNSDGSYTGTVMVAELDYDEKGQPTIGSKYQDPKKANLIFNYKPEDKSVKIVKSPHRHLSKEDEGGTLDKQIAELRKKKQLAKLQKWQAKNPTP